ncbi:hypothetical protein JYU34_021416 [Plutella xylostella]|uniref:Uncharacterized protein n=1 Tax=Plutella xylostella TaxID=51655 RepID=A0ABQ7PTQ4_PLUXY|nr:hypothetical protein JYU34_021416 [Plutella xylostella]
MKIQPTERRAAGCGCGIAPKPTSYVGTYRPSSLSAVPPQFPSHSPQSQYQLLTNTASRHPHMHSLIPPPSCRVSFLDAPTPAPLAAPNKTRYFFLSSQPNLEI